MIIAISNHLSDFSHEWKSIIMNYHELSWIIIN